MLRGENCKHTTQHLSMECGRAGEWYVGTYVRGTMFLCCIGFIMNCCVFNSVVRCFLFSYCPQLSLPDRICEFILCISKLLLLTLSWMQKISSFEFSRARRKWKFLKFLQQLSVLISKWECETIPTLAFLPSAFLSSSGFLAGNRSPSPQSSLLKWESNSSKIKHRILICIRPYFTSRKIVWSENAHTHIHTASVDTFA